MDNSHMKVILLSDKDDAIKYVPTIFERTIRPCIFELHVVSDARALLQNTDFKDLSQAILVDMRHAHAKDIVNQLYVQKITECLSVVVICRWSDATRDADVQFGRDHGASTYFIIGHSNPITLPALIYDKRKI